MGYYKVGQGMLLCGAGSLLQGGAIAITNYNRFFTKWTRYCKVKPPANKTASQGARTN